MSFRKLRTLVIEDEEVAREGLIKELNKTLDFEVVGWADSIASGYDLIEKTPADALFLDIELAGGTAFDLMGRLKRQNIEVPPVIIVTGYEKLEYARQINNAFKSEVIHILDKPFWKHWQSEQEKILDAIYVRNQAVRIAQRPFTSQLISIQDGRQTYLLNPADIVLVRTGAKNQGRAEVVLQHKTIGCNLSLSQLLSKLPGEFVQINRFEAINITWIEMLDQTNKEVLLRNGESLLIGPKFYPMLAEIVEQ